MFGMKRMDMYHLGKKGLHTASRMASKINEWAHHPFVNTVADWVPEVKAVQKGIEYGTKGLQAVEQGVDLVEKVADNVPKDLFEKKKVPNLSAAKNIPQIATRPYEMMTNLLPAPKELQPLKKYIMGAK